MDAHSLQDSSLSSEESALSQHIAENSITTPQMMAQRNTQYRRQSNASSYGALPSATYSPNRGPINSTSPVTNRTVPAYSLAWTGSPQGQGHSPTGVSQGFARVSHESMDSPGVLPQVGTNVHHSKSLIHGFTNDKWSPALTGVIEPSTTPMLSPLTGTTLSRTPIPEALDDLLNKRPANERARAASMHIESLSDALNSKFRVSKYEESNVKPLVIVQSFLPRIVIERFQKPPMALPSKPFCRVLSTAVMFADVSGFTAMTERLAKRGDEGAELLSTMLNAYLEQLIQIISIFEGDVVKFAGDALLVLFKAQKSKTIDDACLRSVQCALQIQQKLDKYDGGEGVSFRLRIGLSVGLVSLMFIGGVNHQWDVVFVGDAIQEVSHAESTATPGEIVASMKMTSHLPESVQFSLHDSHTVTILQSDSLISPANLQHAVEGTPSPLLLSSHHDKQLFSTLKAFIPFNVLNRLEIEKSGWLSELRVLTIIFLNFPPMDFSKSSSCLTKLQRIMKCCQQSLNKYEGSMNKFLMDDKGLVLIAAFGLPPFAHEDDPSRAIHCALSIHALLKTKGIYASIGISHGRVFCGSVGSSIRREYTMLGDTVNLAARIMQRAKGQVLCDSSTFALTNMKFTFESLQPIQLKGKTLSVQLYRIGSVVPDIQRSNSIHSSQRSSNPSPLSNAFSATSSNEKKTIGRSREWQVLLKFLEDCQKSQSPTCLIMEGDAGVGKSTLVKQLKSYAQSAQVQVISGYAVSLERKTPYFVWRNIFYIVLGLHTCTSIDDMANKVQSCLLTTALPLLPLLNPILPFDFPSNEFTRGMNPEVRAAHLSQQLLNILLAYCQLHKLLIVLEDAHLMDLASWELTRLLMKQEDIPCGMVIVTRSKSEDIPEFFQSIPSTNLPIHALSELHIYELVCAFLSVSSMDESLLALIMRKSQGNPYFAEELSASLQERSLILVEDNIAKLIGDEALLTAHVPDTIHGVITSRIDRLNLTQQLVIKVASVIGRQFTMEELEYLYPTQTNSQLHSLSMDLFTLVDMGILIFKVAHDEKMSIYSPDASNTPGILASAESKVLTHSVDACDKNRYIFKQVVTMEVAYNLMSFAQRRQLHKNLAQWYELRYPNHLHDMYELLAYHWKAAEDFDHTVFYLAKAGELSLRSFSNQEALILFSEVLDLSKSHLPIPPTSEQLFLWEKRLGEAYFGLGNLMKAREHVQHALSLLGHRLSIPKTRRGLAKHILAETAILYGQRLFMHNPMKDFNHSPPPESEDPAQEIHARSKTYPREFIIEILRAYEILSEIFAFQQDLLRMLVCSLRQFNVAQVLSQSLDELARAFANAGHAASQLPMHSESKSYFEKAFQIVSTSFPLIEDEEEASPTSPLTPGTISNTMRTLLDSHETTPFTPAPTPIQISIPTASAVYLKYGIYALTQCNWQLSETLLGTSLCLSRFLGDSRTFETNLSIWGWLYWWSGRLEECFDIASRLIAFASTRGDIQLESVGHILCCAYHFMKDDPPEASKHLQWVQNRIDVFPGRLDKGTYISFLALAAWNKFYQKEFDAAIRFVDLLIKQVALQEPIAFTALLGYWMATETLLETWKYYNADQPQYFEMIQILFKYFKDYCKRYPLGESRRLLARGRFHCVQKEWEKSEAKLHKALATATQFSNILDISLVKLHLGKLQLSHAKLDQTQFKPEHDEPMKQLLIPKPSPRALFSWHRSRKDQTPKAVGEHHFTSEHPCSPRKAAKGAIAVFFTETRKIKHRVSHVSEITGAVLILMDSASEPLTEHGYVYYMRQVDETRKWCETARRQEK